LRLLSYGRHWRRLGEVLLQGRMRGITYELCGLSTGLR
jgi:hypothetical protein